MEDAFSDLSPLSSLGFDLVFVFVLFDLQSVV